jgi:zinc transport system permease protein
MPELLGYAFMQRALVAALLVGLCAPVVGAFLVQRRMSLIGDGIGHVALAGVAVGVVTGTQPVLSALVMAVLAAVIIEVIRTFGRTSADVALAVLFYGGIAAGVVILSQAKQGAANLTAYLFGAITTTSDGDLLAFAALAATVIGVTGVLRPRLFAVADDEEYARATGVPVTAYNLLLGVLTAVTVVVAMRVVGLLLISALMIVPNAAGQILGRSFAGSLRWAVAIAVAASVGGVVTSYYANTPSGGTIVLLTVAGFVAVASGQAIWFVVRRRPGVVHADHEHSEHCGHQQVTHDGHVDYIHDGELHAPHSRHYHVHDGAGGGGER